MILLYFRWVLRISVCVCEFAHTHIQVCMHRDKQLCICKIVCVCVCVFTFVGWFYGAQPKQPQGNLMNREASYSYSRFMQVIALDCLAYDLSGAS